MRKILTLILLCTSVVYAQETIRQTLRFSITGRVKKESIITMDSLNTYAVKVVGDIKITNHLGEFKHTDDHLKGVLLKDVLSHTVIATGSPKLLSRFYFACIGADGYTVVYSWNELFNSEVGNHVFIIMEKNGITADKMPESLQMTSTTDFKTGRRYLHNLSKIMVKEAE